MSIEKVTTSMSELEVNIEKLMLETKVEMLESSLSSTIAFFSTVGTIAAIVMVGICFLLNRTVKNKLDQVDQIHNSIITKEQIINLKEKSIIEYYKKSETFNSNIENILTLKQSVINLEKQNLKEQVYWKVFLEVNRVINSIRKEILLCEQVYMELEKEGSTFEPKINELIEQDKVCFLELRSEFLSLKDINWDFEDFCAEHFIEIENGQVLEIIEGEKYMRLHEILFILSAIAPELERYKMKHLIV